MQSLIVWAPTCAKRALSGRSDIYKAGWVLTCVQGMTTTVWMGINICRSGCLEGTLVWVPRCQVPPASPSMKHTALDGRRWPTAAGCRLSHHGMALACGSWAHHEALAHAGELRWAYSRVTSWVPAGSHRQQVHGIP